MPPEVVAPPEAALISAIPLAPLARKVTVARPLASVLASAGSMTPSVVMKVIRVPLCGGVPEDSSTWATIVAVPFADGAVVAVERRSRDAPLAWPHGYTALRARRYGEATLWYGFRS